MKKYAIFKTCTGLMVSFRNKNARISVKGSSAVAIMVARLEPMARMPRFKRAMGITCKRARNSTLPIRAGSWN